MYYNVAAAKTNSTHTRALANPLRHDSCVCDIARSYVTCLIHIWHAIFICGSTHAYLTWPRYIWHDSFIDDTTHSFVTGLSSGTWWESHKCHMTYEWVMSDIWMSQVLSNIHMWHNAFVSGVTHLLAHAMSHVTYDRVMSHMIESCHIWSSHVTYDRVMSHMNEACHVMSNVSSSSTSSQHIPVRIMRYDTPSHRTSMLQCVAVRCRALQCVAVHCSALQCIAVHCSALWCVAVRCSALQCVRVCE